MRFGVCPCAWALFWLGHFLLPMLRPPTKPPSGRQCGRRCPCGQGRTFWGPNFPKICPCPGRGSEKIRGRSPTALPPKNTTFGHIGKPLVLFPRRGGACQHARILGGRAVGGAHGLGGSPKAPPPVVPLPARFAAGFCGGRWRGGGLAPWGWGPRCPLPLPRPPGPPSPCAVAPRRSRFRSVARPASPLPSQLVTCRLPSLCRVAVLFGH